SANLQGIVRLENCDIPGILGIHVHRCGPQINPVDVKELGIALIHLHQEGVGSLPVISNDVDANFFVRREVLCLLGGNIGLMQTPVLVATDVLGVENVLVVVLPKEVSNAAILVVGNGPVIVLTNGSNPNIQYSVDRSEISQLRPIRRDLWVRPFRIPEQDVARNEGRWKFFLPAQEPSKESENGQNKN